MPKPEYKVKKEQEEPIVLSPAARNVLNELRHERMLEDFEKRFHDAFEAISRMKDHGLIATPGLPEWLEAGVSMGRIVKIVPEDPIERFEFFVAEALMTSDKKLREAYLKQAMAAFKQIPKEEKSTLASIPKRTKE